MPAAIPIAGAVAGSVVSGAMNKSGSGGSQTVDKSPWEPAQPFLKDLIKDGQSLYSNYQQNPFSDAQKTAFQNQFTMNDVYNNELMPALGKGLSDLLGPQFGDIGGILSGGLQRRQATPEGSAPGRYAKPSFGLLDFNAMNPWTNGSATPASTAKPEEKTPETPEQKAKREQEEYMIWNMMRSDGGE